MRIKISFTKSTEKVPNNLSVVNSYIHKCLGKDNEYHDKPSNYNIGRLYGGEVLDDGKYFNYPNGGYLMISALDIEFMNKLLLGIMNNQTIGYGMMFNGVDYINDVIKEGVNYFKTTSMGFILNKPKNYQYNDPNDKHKGFFTLYDSEFNAELKKQTLRKLNKINPKLNLKDFDISVIENPLNKVAYRVSKNWINSSNICHIMVKGSKEAIETIYNYGVGKSCGSGFGMIYPVSKSKLSSK